MEEMQTAQIVPGAPPHAPDSGRGLGLYVFSGAAQLGSWCSPLCFGHRGAGPYKAGRVVRNCLVKPSEGVGWGGVDRPLVDE